MKTWYRAVCDSCKEACHVLVKSNLNVLEPSQLPGHTDGICQFLSNHYGCELRLAWRDDHIDNLYAGEYQGLDERWPRNYIQPQPTTPSGQPSPSDEGPESQ